MPLKSRLGEERIAPRLSTEGLSNLIGATTTTMYCLHGNPIQLLSWSYTIGNPRATIRLSILSFTKTFHEGLAALTSKSKSLRL